jgi:hypothetical protein
MASCAYLVQYPVWWRIGPQAHSAGQCPPDPPLAFIAFFPSANHRRAGDGIDRALAEGYEESLFKIHPDGAVASSWTNIDDRLLVPVMRLESTSIVWKILT